MIVAEVINKPGGGGRIIIRSRRGNEEQEEKVRHPSKEDGSLYLEAVDLTLRETSQLGSVPSSERPKKITATKELVLPENQLVKKKAMALQA